MQNKIYPVIDMAATGRNILRLRLEHGLSVRDMQEWFGFENPRAIYKWQAGQTLPSVDNLFALSSLLNVPMEQILVQSVYKLNIASFEQSAEPGCSVVFYRLYYRHSERCYRPERLGLPVVLGQLA